MFDTSSVVMESRYVHQTYITIRVRGVWLVAIWFSDDLAQCIGRLHLMAGRLECLRRVSAFSVVPCGEVLTDILIGLEWLLLCCLIWP
jgi:hypothetical protein